ncbi:hypothetical protein [Cellulophaga fucicola]|uniref:EF hand n=1 Tax=Cellulophaga fucicola TaxID=76595 RepID=A0A1K1QNU3_9FLAO|nr:hypothetical protein [Cellulophaga fucicola]SFW61307.1 EF hand [Cellulophaga fucicola]
MKKQFKILVSTSLVIAFTACKSSQDTTDTSNNRKPQDASQLFKKMDTNNDGKISKYEAKGKLKENFLKRDKNNDGFITRNEMTIRNR